MESVKVSNLRKRFSIGEGQVRAVDGISFTVEEGEFFTLLGPSGCGKTTTLRCIAGLENPEEGDIYIGDKPVYSSAKKISTAPHKRPIGMVFQSYAIWPHMTVFENAAFPLKVDRKGLSSRQIRDKVREALRLVRLDGLEKRPAPQLSGGQQQRLALARALLREPKVMLLDEPLTNLDAKLREEMRLELRDLMRRLKITSIYVTHDQLEALTMSNRIAVMLDGQLMQVGDPKHIYSKPENKFVADFIGTTNFLEGVVADGTSLETDLGPLKCGYLPDGMAKGAKLVLSIRPENVELYRSRPNADNVLEGRAVVAAFMGEYIDCRIAVKDALIRVRAHGGFSLEEGERLYLRLPPEHCVAIPLA
ncbi:MAG TPA: ABC transporter ATP-binding protein [Dehalococcoidia bacterium]|nr:ABC transporter ATP-binding protein [Dehalococcoidia bacterium]